METVKSRSEGRYLEQLPFGHDGELQRALAQGDAVGAVVTLSKLKAENDEEQTRLLLAYATECLQEERKRATTHKLEAASYRAELEARVIAQNIAQSMRGPHSPVRQSGSMGQSDTM